LNSTLILGWGNPLFGDDGFGVKVVEKLMKMNLPKDVRVESCSSSPLSVMRKMLSYRKVIIIDTLQIPQVKEGSVLRLNLKELCDSPNLINPHSLSLPAVLEIYRTLYPNQVPDEILVVGVCVGPTKVREGLSEEVEAKIDEVVELVMREVGGKGDE